MSNKFEPRLLFSLSVIKFVNVAASIFYSALLGWLYAVGPEITAWFTAITLRQVFFSLLQSGRISSAFVPEYIRISQKQSKQASIEFSSTLMTWFFISSFIGCILASLIIDLIINLFFSGLSNATLGLSQSMALTLIWIIILDVIRSVLDAVLRAEGAFKTPELANLASAISLVVFVFFGNRVIGIWILPLAAYAQSLIYLFVLVFKCRSLKIMPTIQFTSPFLRKNWLFKTLSSLSFYSVASQGVVLCLSNALTNLPDVFYPSFKYMQGAIGKVTNGFLAPIMAVGITKTAKESNKELQKKFLKQNNSLVACLILTLVVGYFLTAKLAISFIWNVTDSSTLAAMWNCGFVILVSSLIGMGFSTFRMKAYSLNHAGSLYTRWGLCQIFATPLLYFFAKDWTLFGLALILWSLNIAMGVVSFSLSKKPDQTLPI